LQSPQFPIVNPSKKGGLTYHNSGVLYVEVAKEIPVIHAPPKPAGYEIHFSATEVARMDG
jgi:hypothetical protein